MGVDGVEYDASRGVVIVVNTWASPALNTTRPHAHGRALGRGAKADAMAPARARATVARCEPSKSAHVGPVDARVRRTTPRARTTTRRTDVESGKTSRRRGRYDATDGDVLTRNSGGSAREARDGAEARFPYDFGFEFAGGTTCGTSEMISMASETASDGRMARLENVLANRTFDLLPVMEGVYDVGNMLAVCRSTEALGIGCAAIVSSKGLNFKASGRTSGGALKWQRVERFDSTTSALRAAKSRGMRVLTTEFEGAYPMSHYDWTIPTAVVFGNEKTGVSEEARAMSDGGVFIPMYGFTESLNISVAAALVMSHAVSDRIARRGFHGDLSDEEKEILRGVYASKLIPHSQRQGHLEELVKRFKMRGTDFSVLDALKADVDDEELDENTLIEALGVKRLVGRRTPPRDKDLGEEG